MALPTTFRLLVPLIGYTPLLPPCRLAAGGAAVALPSIAKSTDEEKRPTRTTSALPKNNLQHDFSFVGTNITPGNRGDMRLTAQMILITSALAFRQELRKLRFQMIDDTCGSINTYHGFVCG